MTTANDLITGALEEIQRLPAGQTISAEDMAKSLRVLNEMLHGMPLWGPDLSHTDVTQTDELLFPDEHMEGLRAMLAVRLGPPFETTALPETKQRAARAEELLHAEYKTIPPLNSDLAFVPMNANKSWRWF